MNTSELVGQVRMIPIGEIRPSSHNPRGAIKPDDSFERLAASISEVGLLVPVVVKEIVPSISASYELVDGERRYWAAKALGLDSLPAHVIRGPSSSEDLRHLMFHLHMTREQWGPISQCRSLDDTYPELREGLRFDEKAEWARKLSRATGMPAVTARDRVHVLAWPKDLKDEIYTFDEREPKKNIYSYVLALEASIVEPSVRVFHDFYDGTRPVELKANSVRKVLLTKTVDGLETGTVTNREQIRDIGSLFGEQQPPKEKRIALTLFKKLVDVVNERTVQFDDIKAEIAAGLPSQVKERTTKPQRLIASIRALDQALETYEPEFIDNSVSNDRSRRKLRSDLGNALTELKNSINKLEARLNG